MACMSDTSGTTTIAVRRAELLDLKRLQLAAEEAEGRKPTMSEIIRRGLDALAATAQPHRPGDGRPAADDLAGGRGA